jgi:hypothetical protein
VDEIGFPESSTIQTSVPAEMDLLSTEFPLTEVSTPLLYGGFSPKNSFTVLPQWFLKVT